MSHHCKSRAQIVLFSNTFFARKPSILSRVESAPVVDPGSPPRCVATDINLTAEKPGRTASRFGLLVAVHDGRLDTKHALWKSIPLVSVGKESAGRVLPHGR